MAESEGCINGKNKRYGDDLAPMDGRYGEEALQNLISDVSAPAGGNFLELAQLVLATQVPDNSSDAPLQGGDGDGPIDPTPTEPASLPAAKLVPRALLAVSLLTVSMAMATAFYKAPSGVVFGHHKLAYYLAIAAVFVAGVAEACTAFWISAGSLDAHRRRSSFGRVVLCASIVPFVIIAAMGGFTFIHG